MSETPDQFLARMAGRRVDPDGCSRCGRTQASYFRDHAERRVGFCCVIAAVQAARSALADAAIAETEYIIERRLREIMG